MICMMVDLAQSFMSHLPDRMITFLPLVVLLFSRNAPALFLPKPLSARGLRVAPVVASFATLENP